MLLYVLLAPPRQAAAQTANTFTNPLLESGADPWVTFDHGFYYYMNTTGVNLTIWRTRDVTDLHNAEKVVWIPPGRGAVFARHLDSGTASPGRQVLKMPAGIKSRSRD